MQQSHKARLSAHPGRTKEWLRERVADGFEVHHCDENPYNNDPDNLILIDKIDHKRLHNKRGVIQLGKQFDPARGKESYTLRAFGLSWEEIAKRLDRGSAGFYLTIAREYARVFEKQWPVGKRKPRKTGVKYRSRHPVYRGY